MQRLIGFMSPNWIYQIGPKEDILAFFQLVDQLVVRKFPNHSWSLITDRFYKRYLRWEELEPAKELMDKIKEEFSNVPSKKVKWEKLGITENTQLKLDQSTLAGVFERFFKSFENGLEGCKLLKNKEEYYHHMRIIVSDIPDCIDDEDRLLEDYDNLEGEPFWWR